MPLSTDCNLDTTNNSACQVGDAGFAVTDKMGNDITTYTNATSITTLSASIPTGWYEEKSCKFTDNNLLTSNIANGISIFGVSGTSAGIFSLNTNSQAYRDPGSIPVANHMDNQSISQAMTLYSEKMTYAGISFPTSGGYNYRDISSLAKDDEGYLGTSCKYAPRPTVVCGTTQTSIATRIADCLNLNGTCSDGVSATKSACDATASTWTTTATWDGATQCNGGQGTWKLVTLAAANKEVWQDQRTGLLWSSKVSEGNNWCQASGNTQQAPVTYSQSFKTALFTAITGNGKISNISGGSSSSDETITITFTSPTAFTVSGSGPSCDDSQSPTITGALTATAESSVTYSVSNVCSFTITQGATNFVSGDTFVLNSTDAGYYDCTAGGNAALISNLGSPLQPAIPVSLCAEAAGLSPSGETWTNGGYMTAKGGLGKNSVPSISWRLATIKDYNAAEVNGIRSVMPDMGIVGAQRPTRDVSTGSSSYYEWSASVVSYDRYNSWVFSGSGGNVGYDGRDYANAVRCVGR